MPSLLVEPQLLQMRHKKLGHPLLCKRWHGSFPHFCKQPSDKLPSSSIKAGGVPESAFKYLQCLVYPTARPFDH